MYVCMYVCMSVCNEFTIIEIYGFIHNSRTFWHITLMIPSQWSEGSRSWRIEDNARTSPEL